METTVEHDKNLISHEVCSENCDCSATFGNEEFSWSERSKFAAKCNNIEKECCGISMLDFFVSLVPSSKLYKRISKAQVIPADKIEKELSIVVPQSKRMNFNCSNADEYCTIFYGKAVMMLALVKNLSIEEANELVAKEFENEDSEILIPWITKLRNSVGCSLTPDDSCSEASHTSDNFSIEESDEGMFYFEL